MPIEYPIQPKIVISSIQGLALITTAQRFVRIQIKITTAGQIIWENPVVLTTQPHINLDIKKE